jgi:hypothetical protein
MMALSKNRERRVHWQHACQWPPRRTLLHPLSSFRVVRIDATLRVRASHEERRGLPMIGKPAFWWSELSKWEDRDENEWIQWIELVAGLSAMIVLTSSVLAVWGGKSP